MKKSLKFLAASLLFSSVLFTTPTLNTIVHAEETSVSSSEDTSELRGRLETLVAEANSVISSGSYTEASIEIVKNLLPGAQNALDNNLEDSYQAIVSSLKNALDTLIPETTPESTDTSTTTPESTDSSSTTPSSTDSSSTTPSSTDSSSTDSSSTTPSSTDSSTTTPSSTDSSTTTPSSTDSSSTDSSSSDELKPTIKIADQTMYVGQSLTEEMILSWATFENADGYMVGFEIIGAPIQVTQIGNTLVDPGTYSIRYYISELTRSTANVIAEKIITLTILPENANPLKPVAPIEENNETKAPGNDLLTPVANPVSNKNQKPIASAQTKAKQLPSTGETNNGMMVASAGVMLIAGAYIFRKKQLAK
ncbi:LPXTG cell wall anchor domain-containing protein [Enterococcus ureilyticus]|uniref:LPXTG cell wall anchor domain-containing protein n=1 Tax=Enterococcus ureilyticus TaxID=1131292 RepID=UPI001A926ABF|nr:LPXTG cell wall anchor domain-containing protein [Enterococcus ureilyticus]MBO0446630.1 LPXTG cell wall anchor domain-containing protein [Enterococcus ureilyticus]